MWIMCVLFSVYDLQHVTLHILRTQHPTTEQTSTLLHSSPHQRFLQVRRQPESPDDLLLDHSRTYSKTLQMQRGAIQKEH